MANGTNGDIGRIDRMVDGRLAKLITRLAAIFLTVAMGFLLSKFDELRLDVAIIKTQLALQLPVLDRRLTVLEAGRKEGP